MSQQFWSDFGRLPHTFKPSYHAYRLLEAVTTNVPAGNFSARYQKIVGQHNEEA
jgi:hypothetical protein